MQLIATYGILYIGGDNVIKSIKVRLLPNNKQENKLFQYSGTARFAYNWTIARIQENYKNGEKFISDSALRKEFTQLKKQEEYSWLNEISNNVTKQAIKDACDTYKSFFKGNCKYPKFKSKKDRKFSFYQDSVQIKFTETHVKMEGFAKSKKANKQKLNWIKLAEKNRVPVDSKYYNPRITHDGLYWWISVGVEYENKNEVTISDGIGIDLGIKDLAICSNGSVYKNINKTTKVKKLEKKKKRLQRKVSKKYELNKNGANYIKTNNIKKIEKQILKLNKRLTNIRNNYVHQTTSEIVKRKPSFIVMEDLNVVGMMKNKYLSKAVQEQKFYEFKRQIEYKSAWNNIEFIQVDRWYPSSKTCCECGNIKKDLKLSDRIYKCSKCGNEIDRDFNASVNLKNYGEIFIKSIA